ncbi:MAG: flagellar protein FlaR [Bdellovibrionales bacterium]
MIQKVVVIGNSCGGKTTLSRHLAKRHNLPLTHVDSIQFLPPMRIRPHAESIAELRCVQAQESWLIDGYGPLDILEERLRLANKIVFLDWPLWHHYWWCSKRQVKNLWSRRVELPADCNENGWVQVLKSYRSLWQVHQKMRPEMLRILLLPDMREKTIFIHNNQDWRKIWTLGLSV